MNFKVTILFCLATFISKAAVFNVSNLPGSGLSYTNVNSAIAAAAPGDTVYVNGSTTIYPDFTIDKSIVVMGTGGFPQTEYGLKSRFDRITFTNNVSNVKITGLSIAAYHLDFYGVSNVHNVLITNNFFEAGSYGNLRFEFMTNSSDIRVFNNVFAGGGANKIAFSGNTGCSNIIIDHNIINGCIQSLNILNTIIQNNIFYNPNNSNAFVGSNSLMVLSNNIFYGADPINNTSASIFNNNISYSPSVTLNTMGGSNIDNVNPQFVNVPTTGLYNVSHNFNLQSGSPCIAAGADGLDLGYYGGNESVTPLGEPYNMPVIRLMNIQNTTVPQNGNVNVKVRSTKSRDN